MQSGKLSGETASSDTDNMREAQNTALKTKTALVFPSDAG
jgi:hypothetical protein